MQIRRLGSGDRAFPGALHRLRSNSEANLQIVSSRTKINFDPRRRALIALTCSQRYTGGLFEVRVQFFDFNENYLEQLRNRDFLTEQHFFKYFSELLLIKLRSRVRSSQAVEDIQQETFLRVLKTLRTEDGIRSPEKFGAFVNSVCNNVLLEFYRSSSRPAASDENLADPPDTTIDLDGMLTTRETREHVRKILEQLAEKDRRLLRALFIEDKDKDEICREFGVDRDYLRVMLHRAKQNFRACYEGYPDARVGQLR